jgi:7-cyano-7-deazaguanine reductase
LAEKDLTTGLKSLGSEGTEYLMDRPRPELLETFPNPMPKHNGAGTSRINITTPEFTSLCPMTGQPDFATIVVDYEPRDKCVESKSWKLYVFSFRNHGEFHESCVTRIFDDLWALLDPTYLCVHGQFTPRGGIPFWPKVERWADDHFVPASSVDEQEHAED